MGRNLPLSLGAASAFFPGLCLIIHTQAPYGVRCQEFSGITSYH